MTSFLVITSSTGIPAVPEGSPSHSQAYLDAGKTEKAHDAIMYGAKILAGTAADLITVPGLMDEVQSEYRANRERQMAEARG